VRPRIGVLDIETSPLVAIIWRLGEQVVTLDQLEEDWNIISYCWKWVGEKGFIYEDTGGRGAAKTRDDKKLMRGLWALLDEADIVIAQNGKAFDVPKINARLIIHGYKPYSPIKIVDTLKSARKHFGFTSNKLAYLSEKLAKTKKSEHKKFPGLELWRECMKDNPAAWAEMKRYNPTDVISTAEVYETMLPWITNHPNMAVYVEDKNPRCTTCASDRLQSRGDAVTQRGRYDRYHCQACGAWPRGKLQQLSHEVRKNLLVGV
jgi:hypothetical protein